MSSFVEVSAKSVIFNRYDSDNENIQKLPGLQQIALMPYRSHLKCTFNKV